MILPTNPRSATFAVAEWIHTNGPAMQPAIIAALTGRFSNRTIAQSLNEMKRVGMAYERLPDQAIALTNHVKKFFDTGFDQVAAQSDAPIVAPAFRKDWRTGSLSPQYMVRARPMRPGAEDYKNWPSRHVPATASHDSAKE